MNAGDVGHLVADVDKNEFAALLLDRDVELLLEEGAAAQTAHTRLADGLHALGKDELPNWRLREVSLVLLGQTVDQTVGIVLHGHGNGVRLEVAVFGRKEGIQHVLVVARLLTREPAVCDGSVSGTECRELGFVCV